MGFSRFVKDRFGIINKQETDLSLNHEWMIYDNPLFVGSDDCREFYKSNFPTAYQRISDRCYKLFNQNCSAKDSPKRGVALKNDTVREPNVWLKNINDKFIKHYGDLIDEISDKDFKIPNDERCHRYVAAVHEYFQWPKQGYFGPVQVGALRKAQQQYLDIVKENHSTNFSTDDIELAFKAMQMHVDVDYAGLSKGLIAKTVKEAVNLANTQGLACGPIQMSKDSYFGGHYDYVLKSEVNEIMLNDKCKYNDALNKAKRINQYAYSPKKLISLWVEDAESLSILEELNAHFNVNIKPKTKVLDGIIYIIEHCNLKPDDNEFIYLSTLLVRHQVGGIQYDSEKERDLKFFKIIEFCWEMVKDAKTRMIQAPSPIYNVANAMIIQAIDEWYKDNEISFRVGFYDPVINYKIMDNQYKVCETRNSTLVPFDYELHDARLHIEWILNIINVVYRSIIHADYHYLLDWMMLSYANKITMVPSNNKSKDYVDFVHTCGGIGSGDPSTNNLGSTGTRTLGAACHIQRPDIFLFNSDAGSSNGDDTQLEVYKKAVLEHGVEGLNKIANDCIKFSRYKFNESKLFMRPFEDGSMVGHWDQRAHYYSKDLDKTMIVGSCLRYFSRVYGSERLGSRVLPEEGILDQISVLNNTVSFVGTDDNGNLLFTIEALGLDLLKDFINNDPTLNTYISTKSKSYITSLIDKTLGRKSVDEFLNEHNYGLFDRDKVEKLMNGEFSFTPIVWLLAKGTDWLDKHSNLFCGKTLLFYINAEKDVKIVEAL